MIRFVIVTECPCRRGSALRILEDMGYFCIDNLPVLLIPKLTKSIYGREKTIDRVALGIDIRNQEGLSALDDILEAMKEA